MTSSRPIRYVVFHQPGTTWKPGGDFREQEGVRQHGQHDLKFHKQHKWELGDPFLQEDAGGMMVATRDVSRGT